MAFFTKNRFVWNEPWFFVHQIRHWTAWFFVSFLKAVRLQEVQIGTPGESTVSILLYFVVISFATQDGEFEYGLRDDGRDFGAFDDTKRATAGVRL